MENITPYEAWYRSKPIVRHLKVFRCVAYAHIPDAARGKLDDKAETRILIGYSESSKAYKLYNPTTKKVGVTRDVRFNEYSTYDGTTKLSMLEDEEVMPQPENAPSTSNSIMLKTLLITFLKDEKSTEIHDSIE